MLAEGRKQETQDWAIKCVALTDIGAIPLCEPKYHEELRLAFYKRATGSDIVRRKNAALDPTDESTVALITNLTLQASRLTR